MSLFVINRYEGEKEETENERNHLSELLKRIEERKLERAVKSNCQTQINRSQNTQDLNYEKRKRKAENLSECSIENITLNENILSDVKEKKKICVSDHRKSKKKKNAAKALQNENTNDQNNEIFNKSLDSIETQEKIADQYSDFIIMGTKSKQKKHKVKRILPEWLSNPKLMSIDLNSGPTLEEMNLILDIKLITALRANNINKLFPVQANMISWLLKCDKDREQKWWLRDACISAPTGSGKTLAYVLPIVQILQSRLVPKIRCLVVAPVQELAAQIYKVMITYISHTNLRVGLLSGASSFYEEQRSILRENARGKYISIVDIVIATPGRLINHILKTSGFSLDDLRFLVIDEADKAVDWLEYLPEPHYRTPRLTLFNLCSSKIPAQKLLFSATLSQDPEKLSRFGLFQPILFTSVLVTGKDDNVNLDKEVGNFIGRYTSPEELKEEAVECEAEYKPVALYQLIIRNSIISKILVFTNSGKTAHRLTILLQSFLSKKDIVVGELSAQFASKDREDVLTKFITEKIQILVCSDALARGVDIPNVRLVISYDLPKHINGYIHRAGRTGRAGKSGTAISILIPKQVRIFKHMLNNAHKVVPHVEKLELSSVVNEIDYLSHIDKLKHVLQIEKQNNLLRAKSVKRICSINV
ncbi:ATP-dependent RNA helicase DDX51 isoform X1 [Frieseomelitta varia]|uniref:ATP-dependent RNA helicase DDX51 isoform X1 n=1 Tax=Frieseomelitta varia TaxID=561572 RepID=UPI001CB68706|nr:ATP-dependent RNA helicase DDX51 isoform X1 [Frieseomelitta varia]